MGEQLFYAIPSYKRADKQATLDYLSALGVSRSQILMSVQTEEDLLAYRAAGVSARVSRLLYRPGKNMSDNLNTLLDAIDEGTRVVIMDDDIKSVCRMVSKQELHAIDSLSEWEDFLREGYEAAEGFGSIGFSVYPVCNAYFMSETITPRSLGEGTLLGLTNVHGLRFDPALPVKMDYDLSCRIIKRYGTYPRLNYYCCNAPHYTKGGCEEWWKDAALNRKVARTLVRRYPGIVKLNPSNAEEIKLVKR